VSRLSHSLAKQVLKPVNFGGWLEDGRDPNELTFWVQYWIEAYQFALEQTGDEITFVSYARITEEPESTLARLADQLGIPVEELASKADQLRPPRTHSVNEGNLSGALLERGREIYRRLDRRASIYC
jgi:hypothetical protein